MKKTQILAIAALAAAATFQTAAKAEDPVSPVQGAVCNLYLMNINTGESPKPFIELAASLPHEAAAATFVDVAGEFQDGNKQNGINSNVGMWTGWMKVDRAGTYTFLCRRGYYNTFSRGYRYSVWVNGQKCLEAQVGQGSFNADLVAGFNQVKIVTENYGTVYPLAISYKRAGSVQEPEALGPGDMFYDDEE